MTDNTIAYEFLVLNNVDMANYVPYRPSYPRLRLTPKKNSTGYNLATNAVKTVQFTIFIQKKKFSFRNCAIPALAQIQCSLTVHNVLKTD